ncbi:MAG: hypothetical protein P8170_19895, partial [Gemmatimonadota bacterium]
MPARPSGLALRVLIRTFFGLGWMAAAVVACVALLLLAVQLDPVGRAVLMRGVALATPGWLEVDAEKVSGSWVHSLVVTGLRARDVRSGDLLAADTLTLTYRPLRWRPRRLVLDIVDVAGAALRASRPEDTASSRSAPARPISSEAEGGWTFVLEALSLRRAEGTLRLPEGGRFHAGPVRLTVSGARLGRELHVESWEVEARFAPAGRATGWGELQGTGSITGRAL